MIFLAFYDDCFTVLFDHYKVLVYKNGTQASTGRPGKGKLTTSAGRLGKYTACHRGSRPITSGPVWISVIHIGVATRYGISFFHIATPVITQ